MWRIAITIISDNLPRIKTEDLGINDHKDLEGARSAAKAYIRIVRASAKESEIVSAELVFVDRGVSL